jgi:adenosine deaminase CECR1
MLTAMFRIWEKFNYRTQMMKGLFAYESAFRNYTCACIEDFVRDNIQYAEIRPNFMTTNHLRTDDGCGSIDNKGIMKIIDEEVKKTVDKLKKEGKYFGGLKVIYCTPRSFSRDRIRVALEEFIELKLAYPDLLCGVSIMLNSCYIV